MFGKTTAFSHGIKTGPHNKKAVFFYSGKFAGINESSGLSGEFPELPYLGWGPKIGQSFSSIKGQTVFHFLI
jgi:hypothetical protein